MPEDLFISIDQGGHSTRAIVFDRGGEKRAECASPIDASTDGPRVEIDPGVLVGSLRTVVRGVVDALGAEAARVRRVGLATQRSNAACWDRYTREPLAPVLSWQDRRAPEYLEGLDAGRVHGVTGLFPNPHYGASKLAWCLDHVAAVKRAADEGCLEIGPMASYLAAVLTGSPAAADPVNGSRTLLWRLDDRDWDPELCRHFGIDPVWLPRCVPNRYEFGKLSVSSLDRESPGEGSVDYPLRVVTGDLSAAAFARGRPSPDALYITLGTGAFMQRVEDDCRTVHPRLLNGVLWHDGERGLYSLEGTVNGAGSALTWFAETFDLDSDALYEWLDDYNPDSVEPPSFLNGVSGLGSPFWNPGFESRFVGDGGVRLKAFAIVESIAFLLMQNYEAMETVMPSPSRVVVNGGLSKVDGLCRALAVLTGKPVERSAEPEGTSKGLAYLLADMPAQWSVRTGEVFEPGPCRDLRARYRLWSRRLADALES